MLTRAWTEEEWAAAGDQLAARGWLHPDGTQTTEGAAAQERMEQETDDLCAPLWAPIGDSGTARLIELISPINDAFVAAGKAHKQL